MLRVGLTGGIGSGKTTVAKIFEVLGIPVYYADEETKRLMNTDPVIRRNIVKEFGDRAYDDHGLDRSYLASVVFNDEKKLALLNSLTHPATIEHANKWMQQQHSPYIIKEAALIFESGSNKHLDYVIGVSAPEEIRIRRVMERDGVSEEQVRSRMARQMNEEEKIALCDFVVVNDEREFLITQVLSLHAELVKLAIG